MSYLQQFLDGWVPDRLDLSGDWVVKGLLGPLPVRFLGHTKQFEPMGGGVFAGSNRFLGRLRTGRYLAGRGVSRLDADLEVINIDYNQPENPWVMRGLVDEVRYVEEHRLLGRGVYAPPGWSVRPRNIFWFSVIRAGD